MLKFIGLIVFSSFLNAYLFNWLDTSLFLEQINITGGNAGYLIVGFVFSLLNIILFPIIRVITIPLKWLTLGLFGVILNGLLLWGVEYIMNFVEVAGVTLDVEGIRTYVIGGFLLSIINTIVGWFIR